MDNDRQGQTTENSEVPQESGQARQSRRRFTRSAVAGSAIMLTLGNRVAWGTGKYGDKKDKICVSQHAWESFTDKGYQASAAPADGKIEELEKFREYAESTGQRPFLKDGRDKYCVFKKSNRGNSQRPFSTGQGQGRDYRSELLSWGFEKDD